MIPSAFAETSVQEKYDQEIQKHHQEV